MQHIYLFIDPAANHPVGEMTKDVWDQPESCPFHPYPNNKWAYYGFVVYSQEIAAGDLLRCKLEPANPKEWALYQFWRAASGKGPEAAILKTMWERTSLKELRKTFKDQSKLERDQRMAWAALILRGKADLSHVKYPEIQV